MSEHLHPRRLKSASVGLRIRCPAGVDVDNRAKTILRIAATWSAKVTSNYSNWPADKSASICPTVASKPGTSACTVSHKVS
jgi:hypothetical protein